MEEKLKNAIDMALRFWNISPGKIDENCGTVWMQNKKDGKTYSLSIKEEKFKP